MSYQGWEVRLSNLIPIAKHLAIDPTADVEIWLERIDVLRESYEMITGEDPIDRLRDWLKAANYPMIEHLPDAHREPFFRHLFHAMKKGLETRTIAEQIQIKFNFPIVDIGERLNE